jgi:hypothetical protein
MAQRNLRYGECPVCGRTLAARAVKNTRARAADATYVELPPHDRVPRDQLRAGQVRVVCLPRGRRRAVPALPLGVAPRDAVPG